MFLTGMTGSGKSTLAKALFLSTPAPRLVIDPADSDLTNIPGAVTFTNPRQRLNAAGEDWRQAAVARFVPDDPDDLQGYSDVYRWAYAQGRPRYIWCDEAGIVLPSSGGNPGGRKVLLAGRKIPIGHLGCHTRPRNMDRDLIAQASHVFVFRTPGAPDRRYLAENMGVDLGRFEAGHAALEDHGCLWWNTRAGTLTILDPLRS